MLFLVRNIKTKKAEELKDRRYTLCLNFANKSLKHPKHQHWFSENPINPNPPPPPKTRAGKEKAKAPAKLPKFKPVKARTDRYRDSPIPYLTKLINDNC